MTIEKNIPIPEKRNEHGNIKYPIAEMEVGDSIFLKVGLPCANSTLYRAKQRFNKRDFLMRRENDGFRIWRMK